MNRRRTFVFAAATLFSVAAAGALLTVAASRRGQANARRFDPAAIAALRRNHERMKSLRSLSGVTVWNNSAAERYRLVTEVRLQKPNYAFLKSHSETRSKQTGKWIVTPEPSIDYFSDGVTVRTVAPASYGMAASAPVEKTGANIPLTDPCLDGFFLGDQSAYERLISATKPRDCSTSFIHREGNETLAGTPCQVVTFEYVVEQGPRNMNDSLVKFLTAGRRKTSAPRHWTTRTTVWIDNTGLARRAIVVVRDSGLFGVAKPPNRFKSEWRNVQANPPLALSTAFALPAPLPVKAAPRP